MKLYPNLLVSIKSILKLIFVDNRLADLAIEKIFRENKKYGSRDRKFVAETVYDIVRNLRLYNYTAGIKAGDFSEQAFHNLILTSLIFRKIYPENFEFDLGLKNRVAAAANDSNLPLKIRYSLPDWLDSYGSSSLGSLWAREMQAQHNQADVFLRVNTLKVNWEKVSAELAKEGIQTEIFRSTGNSKVLLKLTERGDVFRTDVFKLGYFEVQDGGSQLISEFLEVKPGERVVDACAGGGGKALHMAALMQNKGKILALDTIEWKLKELKKRAARNGVDIIETRVIDNAKVIKRLHNSADKLLLDVPCSGSGVFRRNPDAKWKLTQERIEALMKLQVDILSDYHMILKPGGVMVYSTCSIFPQENGEQIKKFLEVNPGKFELVKEKQIYTSETGFDSFFMAKLIKL